MVKGINYCSLKNGLEGICTIDDAIDQCKKNNFPALELNFSNSGIVNPSLTIKECEIIKDKIKKADLIMNSCTSGMSWEFNPTSLNKTIREKSKDLHKKAIECTSIMECKSFLFVPGIVNSPISEESVPYEIAMKYAKEAIQSLLPVCEKNNIELCIENVWNGLLLSPIELKIFIESFSNKLLGCYLDIGNLLVYHQDPSDWILTLSSVIKRIQIKDFKKKVGTLNGFCDLLAGDINWPNVMRSLKKINYNNTIIAEMLPWDKGILQRTSVAMDIILGMVEK